MNVRIQPYKAGSKSARALSTETGYRRVRLVRTRFRPRAGDLVINWGSTALLYPGAQYLNHPTKVGIASDKRASLEVFRRAGVASPPWTEDRHVAEDWLEEGHAVVCRTMLRANGGRGIVVVDPDERGRHRVPYAPLYTKYIKKYDEYRVHVWEGQVLDIQQKKRRSDDERDADSRVRNAAGGWVYCRGGIECPPVVAEQAIKAVEALGLDFGAADVGYTRSTATACVYEVNTAPGIEGTTLTTYSAAAHRSARSRGGAHS